jgi:hypothetical protein
MINEMRHWVSGAAVATTVAVASFMVAPAWAADPAVPTTGTNPVPAATAPATPGTMHAHKAKPADPAAQVESRITHMHDTLKITPEQAGPWNAVAEAMRENAKDISALITKRESSAANATAIDDLKSYQDIADAHANGLKRLVPAFQTLYDGMSDAQKKVADTYFRTEHQHSGHPHHTHDK